MLSSYFEQSVEWNSAECFVFSLLSRSLSLSTSHGKYTGYKGPFSTWALKELFKICLIQKNLWNV